MFWVTATYECRIGPIRCIFLNWERSVRSKRHFQPNISPEFSKSAYSSVSGTERVTRQNWRLSQSYKETSQSRWSLQTLLLRCKVGRQYSKSDHELIEQLVYRRTGPIGAAIRINITLSD